MDQRAADPNCGYPAQVMKVPATHPKARAVPRALRRFGQWLADQARRQVVTRNRRVAMVLALITVAVAIIAAHVSEWLVSPGVMILPILCGGLLLWPRALRVLVAIAAGGLLYDVVLHRAGPGIVVTIAATAVPPSRKNADPIAVTGVAIWDDIDPESNHFSIFIQGLSNGWALTDDPVEPGKKTVVRRKTLQLNFRRLGDKYYQKSEEIRFDGPAKWDYRASF